MVRSDHMLNFQFPILIRMMTHRISVWPPIYSVLLCVLCVSVVIPEFPSVHHSVRPEQVIGQHLRFLVSKPRTHTALSVDK